MSLEVLPESVVVQLEQAEREAVVTLTLSLSSSTLSTGGGLLLLLLLLALVLVALRLVLLVRCHGLRSMRREQWIASVTFLTPSFSLRR